MKDLNKAIETMSSHIRKGNLVLFREPHGSEAGARLSRLCISQCMGKGILLLEAPSSLHQEGLVTKSEDVFNALSKWESDNFNGGQTLSSIAKAAVGAGWKIACIDSRTESTTVAFHSKGGQGGRARQEWMAYHIYEMLMAHPNRHYGALLPIGLTHITGTNLGEGYDSLGTMLTGQIAPIRSSTKIMDEKIPYRIVKRGDINRRPHSLTYATADEW